MIKRLIYILLFCLVASVGFGADVYIDPDCGTGGGHYACGDGSAITTPENSWADLTITSGNDYRQLCGTTYAGTITIGDNGSGGNYIVIGAYEADGDFEDDHPSFGQYCQDGTTDKPVVQRIILQDWNGANTVGYVNINSLWVDSNNVSHAITVCSDNNLINYTYLRDSVNGIFNQTDSIYSPGSPNCYAENTIIEYNYINMDQTPGGTETNDGITLKTYADGSIIRYNKITNYDHGGILVWADGCTIEKNYIYGAGNNDEGFGLGTNGTADGNIWRYNFVKDAGMGFELNGGSSNEVYGNVFTCGNNTNFPMATQACVQLTTTTTAQADNVFYNNVIYDNDYGSNYRGIGLTNVPGGGAHGALTGSVITNNVVYQVGDFCLRIAENNSGKINNTSFYNNSCYAYGTNQYAYIADIDDGTNTYTTAANFNAESRGDIIASGNIDTNPSLSNPASYEFWPDNAGDPVVGAGCDMNDSGAACYDATYTADETILHPSTDFSADPIAIELSTQPGSWYIGAYVLETYKLFEGIQFDSIKFE